MKDAPGGGHIASILDPEGFPVNFIYGQTPAQPRDMPEKLVFNDESTKPRARKFQRFEPGPAAMHKVRFGCVWHAFSIPTPPSNQTMTDHSAAWPLRTLCARFRRRSVFLYQEFQPST
jgi:hypothetical protein